MKYAKKFRTAAEMEAAYRELQSAYTRKCQQVSEMEAGRAAGGALPGADAPETEVSVAETDTLITPEIPENNTALPPQQMPDAPPPIESLDALRALAVTDYLRGIAQGQAPVVLTGGAPPLSPPRKPENFEEAGRLARRMFGE